MRSGKSLAILFAFVATLAACVKDPPPPPCQLAPDGASCTAASDCCSGRCSPNSICVADPCSPKDAACDAASDCCSGNCSSGATCADGPCGPPDSYCAAGSECCNGGCANHTCLVDLPVGIDEPCVDDSECASGYCLPASPSRCAEPPVVPTCKERGEPCSPSTAGDCCSKVCDQTSHCGPKKCMDASKPCETNSDCCSLRCSAPGTPAATCLPQACRRIGESCDGAADCCSGICGSGGFCLQLPGKATCGTIGESCVSGTECCSTNCQGGRCWPASSCAAGGDVCWRESDCCSGMCGDPLVSGNPERCGDASGNCTQSGLPCTGPSTCCTRQCADIGWGATVCKIPGGCIMTGDYCDATSSCCGGTNLADPNALNQYGVFCDLAGVDRNSPDPDVYDPSSKDTLTCTRGTACNPTGNICGDIASQNCCVGKKDVCKFDENNIKRCFGRPLDCTDTSTDPCCKTGYDGSPGCCIQVGDLCMFHDQCCDGTECVKDDNGDLRCTGKSCLSNGDTCNPLDSKCCAPLTCQNFESLWLCAHEAPGCTLGSGATCTPGGTAPSCCVPGTVCSIPPGGTTATCTTCAPAGATCAGDGDCCSPNSCDPNLMKCHACIGLHGSCTVTRDCCSGTECVTTGPNSGTCEISIVDCSHNGQPCDTDLDCCAADDRCINNQCTTVACRQLAQQCDATTNVCCPGAVCYANDVNGVLVGECTVGDADCTCRNACVNGISSCSVDTPCCPGSGNDCLDNTTSGPCEQSSLGCTCRIIG